MSKKRQPLKKGSHYKHDECLVRSLAVRHYAASHVPEHAHDWHQLIYASEGVMWVFTPGKEWVVPPSRAVWVPAGVHHSMELSASVLIQTLYINPVVSAPLPTECSAVNISPLLRELILHTISLGYLKESHPVHASLIPFLLHQLGDLQSAELFLPMPRDERALRVVHWLRKHPDERASMKQLARHAVTGVRTLERLFQHETGMSLGKWRMQFRLLQAVRLLSSRNVSITEVALAVGYDSPSAFIVAFKRFFGTTPSQYVE